MGYILGLVINFFWFVVKMFTGYIDVCDTVLVVLVLGGLMQGAGWDMLPAVVLSLVVALILYIVFKHRIGFWIVSAIFSGFWAYALIELWLKEAWSLQGVGYWVAIALVSAFSMWSHYCASHRAEALARLDAKEHTNS